MLPGNSYSLHHLDHLVCCENCLFLWEEQISILHLVYRWLPDTPLFQHKPSLHCRVSAIEALEILQLKYLSVPEPLGSVPSSTLGNKGEMLGWIHGNIILQ